MKQIVSLASATALTAVVALTPVTAQEPGSDDAVLDRIETYLNGLTSLEARILQVSSENTTAEGELLLERPGKMRIDYEPPSDILLLADGEYLIYAEQIAQQATHIKLEDTPAAYLLNDGLDFDDPDIVVSDVERDAGLIFITVGSKADPDAGALTLMFTDEPLELRQWSLVDAQNVEVRVTLYDTRYGEDFDDRLFRLPDGFGEEDE